MGHQRIGRLPRTRRWAAVVKLLDDSPHEVARVAAAVIRAAERRLDRLADERAVPYCYWLLVRLTQAARRGDFVGDAALVGAPVEPDDSAIGYIARLSEGVADSLRRSPGDGAFAELAVESLRASLAEIMGVGAPTLFGSTVQDIQRALRTHSTEKGFATLAHHFFGDFIGRTLRHFLDKEIGDHIGPAYGLSTVDDARTFADALDLYARETARIVQQFAGEWYSKRNWLSEGEISREDAATFVGHAMDKIRSEFVNEARVA